MKSEPLLQTSEPLPHHVQARITDLLETVGAFAALDFSRPASLTDAGDDLDALALGINMLGEEVAAAQQDLTQRVTDRTRELEQLMEELRAEVEERQRAEEALRLAKTHLTDQVAELESVNQEISRLTDLTTFLQVCRDRDEAIRILGDVLPTLFPGSHGAVYSRTEHETGRRSAAAWGTDRLPDEVAWDTCWGMRRAKLYLTAGTDGPRCAHIDEPAPAVSACRPLTADGEMLGLLHIVWPAGEHPARPHSTRRIAPFVEAAAEQISLALANLDLRAALQARSIRDPLTGLFNRRYLDETLQREVRRYERHGTPVALAMIDLDHFKEFNDHHGHDGGDAALTRIAEVLQATARDTDIVCRYGGEELAVVMSGSDARDAVAAAERMRLSIAQLSHPPHGGAAPTLTASFGVADVPGDAASVEGLIGAADSALYAAKRAGRDRVERASRSAER
ncbi:MAG: diguanylate cyclase [Nitriliruptoraceae bacterium]